MKLYVPATKGPATSEAPLASVISHVISESKLPPPTTIVKSSASVDDVEKNTMARAIRQPKSFLGFFS